MRPYKHVLSTYEATDADQVAAAQAVTAGGAMTLSAPVLDIVRPLTIVSAADESDNRFHIVGQDARGNRLEESVAGVDTGTVSSVHCYKTIDSVVSEIAGSGNVSLGILTIVPTPWFPVEWQGKHFSVALSALVAGTLATGYRFESYQGDTRRSIHHGSVFDLIHPINNVNVIDLNGGTPATVTSTMHLTRPCTAVRLVCLEALDAAETITFEVVQGSG